MLLGTWGLASLAQPLSPSTHGSQQQWCMMHVVVVHAGICVSARMHVGSSGCNNCRIGLMEEGGGEHSC